MARLTVNGVDHDIGIQAHRSLLQVLREELHLTGAKYACAEGACGACTVLVDGEPVRACVTPVGEAAGRAVTTVEGLAAEDGSLHPLQRAFAGIAAFQCGFCTPGMVMRAAALLDRSPHPEADEVREAMQGNVCRCCTYPRILDAISKAADQEADADAGTPAPPPLEGRPRRPWDLTRARDRDWFEVLPPGLVVVVPPGAIPQAWSATGGGWLHVGVDGVVTGFTGKVDAGQDNRTALTALIAAELGVPFDKVRLVMGDTDLCPEDMGTFGSRSTPDVGTVLRSAAAAARRLLDAGADPAASPVETVTEPPPVGPLSGRHARVEVRRVGARDVVTGARKHPSDVELPGMLHGARLRPPRIGATLRSVDTSEAEAIDGVTVVREDDVIGAVAGDPPGAVRAVEAMRADWDLEPQPGEDDLVEHLRSHPAEQEGWGGSVRDERGDVDAALESADVRLEATYTTAFVAHVPLETRVAVADWEGERLTVWTGTQRPFGVRSELAERLGVDEALVRVIVPPTGGGFGGKHSVEAAVEAAVFARATGRPVKVRWSRREEFQWGYLRPAAVIDVRSGATRDGSITAWDFRNLNSGAAGLDSPYDATNERIEFEPADSPLAQGSYRGLAATANAFARESHVDELAAACGVDPVEVRERNLADDRLADVLRAAADRGGWGGPEDGAALGIACAAEKDARVATCARVRVVDGRPVVERLVTAFDCGAIVDRDNLANQVEGATVMAIGPALFEAVRFADGCITNGTMTDYRVPRFADVPEVEVVLLDRPDEPPSGAGETPLIAVAPAIANAIFAATGTRLRSMPLQPD